MLVFYPLVEDFSTPSGDSGIPSKRIISRVVACLLTTSHLSFKNIDCCFISAAKDPSSTMLKASVRPGPYRKV
jgi:hypothetical protein